RRHVEGPAAFHLGTSPWAITWRALAARRLFESKKSVQHDLLAVEIDAFRLGEEMGELFPYLHPLIKATAPSGEAVHQRPLLGRDRTLARRAFAHQPGKPGGKQLGEQAERV